MDETSREQTQSDGGLRPVTSQKKTENGLPRRQFLKAGALATVTLGLPLWSKTVAGPFTPSDFDKLVPSDKKLRADWLRSLVERGQPDVWRASELRHVGMPVGGIGCGQLYLAGDGRLWYWQIFKPTYSTDYAHVTTGPHYAKPLAPESSLAQGFALRIKTPAGTQVRELSSGGFADISFRGEYPIGRVRYRDGSCPVEVDLEAFSPFIPLDAEASAQPATVLQFTLANSGTTEIEVEIAGWIQNAVCLDNDQPGLGVRRNRVRRAGDPLLLECSAEPLPSESASSEKPDILFEDFEDATYEGWTVTGTAFGPGPMEKRQMPAYQVEVGAVGQGLVNTHNARQGEDVGRADAHLGTLTSKPFRIERRFITFLIGGGNNPGKTCLNLLVDGKSVASATGHNDNRMRPDCFDVSAWIGQEARLEVVDAVKGGWGNIGLDQIVFTDQVPAYKRIDQLPGFGTLALSILHNDPTDVGTASVGPHLAPSAVFEALSNENAPQAATRPFGEKLVGALGKKVKLGPGERRQVTFALTWYFPDYRQPRGEMAAIPNLGQLRRQYARRFHSAAEVATYLFDKLERLAGTTRLWNQTWYDSTLPYWFLDRTFVTIDTLATTTCHWFDSGRFYGWEGVDCCPGTCQHVWQYAQGMARIFPQLERDLRERIDFGLAWHENGAMDYRGESGRNVAHDGFAGTILRAYREHQMSADSGFLTHLWPRIRKSVEFLMGEDKDQDGVLEGEQFNTLDAAWFGPMGWISSLYLAALQAGREMALEMDDPAFAERCARILERGRESLVKQLFNGEYFIHKPDPKHPKAINTNEGCHIDQVFGQSYLWQLALPRVVPQPECTSALRSLWRYNFTPDIGPYRANFKAITTGRWYAMPGEGGLLMCTWPKGGAERAPGAGNPVFVGYFNECMTGFEYQVAAHMIWEGLITEGLAITRTIHDRYHAAKRNPYNEVECSDHYSRAMMSYGVFLAVCGFEYHGPKGHLGFAPKITPESFRAPFTTAEGWGTFSQSRDQGAQNASIELKWGQLRLRTLTFEVRDGFRPTSVNLTLGEQTIPVALGFDGTRCTIALQSETVLHAGQNLRIRLANAAG